MITRRARLIFLLMAAVIVAVIIGSWWPVYRAEVRVKEATSLKAAWDARTLTLYPNGCVELRSGGGRRTFIFVGKTWRECPKEKK